MLTYQDLLKVDERGLPDFVRSVITDHKSGTLYKNAKLADDYEKCRNTTTMEYQKMITDVYGRQTEDVYSTVHRSTSNFFNIFTTQLNQYLLGNGVTWKNGTEFKNNFDFCVQKAGKYALCGGVSFGFWNYDRLDVFSALEFAPLYDEENGALMAGVKFWQISPDKPMRATLYTIDGYTNYLWTSENVNSNKWKRVSDGVYDIARKPYKIKQRTSEADGTEIYDGENYEKFPIVPLWGNPNHQSELVGLQEKIDAYDFILNGWEDDLDNAQLYWIIKGAGGMDDPDLTRFLDRLKTVKAAAPEDGQEVTPVTVSLPVDARERLLERLERQLYRDAMIMNPEDLASGAATATQIRAAYERQNVKADQFEYCVIDFLQGVLEIAGIDDEPTFTRSIIVNTQEEIQTVIMSANYLSQDYVTKKILQLLGDGDQADEIIKQREAEMMEQMGMMANMQSGEEEEQGATAEDSAAIDSHYMTEFGDDVMKMLNDLLEELNA